MDVGGLWLVPPYPYREGTEAGPELRWWDPRELLRCQNPATPRKLGMRLSNSSLYLHPSSTFSKAFHQLITFTSQ